MNPLSTRELVSRYYTAFNHADWDGMAELVSEQLIHDLNQGERQLGRLRFQDFLLKMARCYLEVVSEVRILVSPDERHAAAEYMVSGQYLSTDQGLPIAHGQRYRLAGGAFFDVADGRFTRVSNYYNLQEWLRQINREAPADEGS